MTNIGDPNYEAELKSALQVADALREATQPGCPRYFNNTPAPTTTHDPATNSTVTVTGDRYGITGGVVHGGLRFNY
uniref:Uncharacterized protein n=1 Tax=Streptomyces sp. F11 TaxID=319318 RepID=Q58IR2_9ACTN|nr:hypothetical protein [Streptomyces sp. F11]AAX51321.1 unknown [Streptomyces sp. F11]